MRVISDGQVATPVMRFDVYGRQLIVERRQGRWSVFHVAGDGKRRRAEDVRIPPAVDEEEIAGYLADLLHEWATGPGAQVRRLS